MEEIIKRKRKERDERERGSGREGEFASSKGEKNKQ